MGNLGREKGWIWEFGGKRDGFGGEYRSTCQVEAEAAAEEADGRVPDAAAAQQEPACPGKKGGKEGKLSPGKAPQGENRDGQAAGPALSTGKKSGIEEIKIDPGPDLSPGKISGTQGPKFIIGLLQTQEKSLELRNSNLILVLQLGKLRHR